jgi:excisionase family DNA binding protein
MDDKWYKVSEAARLLGISTETIRRHIKSGKIEGKKEGNQYVVKLTNVSNSDQHNVAQMTDMKLLQFESNTKLLEERNQVLEQRLRDLEKDKGFLLSQILEKDQLINKLTPLALPESKITFGQRIKRIFRKSKTSK